ncbi:MAG: hypothetical protein JSS20_15520 [Proteobacteria bacterium]|nr:hypothetical protein [Pseudomonadota bacterium]
MFDYHAADLRPTNSLCLVGQTADGKIVATQALRMFSWSGTSFFDEATSLRFFYKDPREALARGERCRVTAEVAKTLNGEICFSGATWYHPSFRGMQLVEFVPQVARAIALTTWNFDKLLSVQAEHIAKKGVIGRSGFKNFASAVHIENSPVGNLTCLLAWATQDELIELLARFADEFELLPVSALRRNSGGQ